MSVLGATMHGCCEEALMEASRNMTPGSMMRSERRVCKGGSVILDTPSISTSCEEHKWLWRGQWYGEQRVDGAEFLVHVDDTFIL